MWLNVVVLLTTLLVALLGSATSVTDSTLGKVVVSGLLVISTGVSIWLRRIEHVKDEEVFLGVRELASRSLPSPASFNYVDDAVGEYLRERLGLHLNTVQHKFENSSTAYIVRILYSDPDPASGLDPDDDDIDWEDYPELTYGVLVIDAEDVREISRLKGRRLEEMLRDQIVDSWGPEGTTEGRAYVDLRITMLVKGILAARQTPRLTISTSHDKQSNIDGIEIRPTEDDPANTSSVLVFDEGFLAAMMQEPVLVRGAMVLREVDSWLAQFADRPS
jgi:hypothetical protein